MNNHKNLFTILGEWWDARQAERRASTQESIPGRWTRLLPTPGNALFTLLLVLALFWAQTVGALPLPTTRYSQSTSTATIPYQGRLADADGNPLTDTVNMIFRLYGQASGGAPLWEEQWTGSNGVQVSDGLFNVMLGSLDPIPREVITGHNNLFLGITVGTDDEMQPRVQLGSVPFAVQALTVPDGSVTTTKIANGAVTRAKLGTASVDRTKLAPMTGIVWESPPVSFLEKATEWAPGKNQIWDISRYLHEAGVPDDAEIILLGWRPSMLSDVSGFRLLNGDDQEVGTVTLGTALAELTWSPVGMEYGTPVAIPGSTRKLDYYSVGGYWKEPASLDTSRRLLIVYGWK